MCARVCARSLVLVSFGPSLLLTLTHTRTAFNTLTTNCDGSALK